VVLVGATAAGKSHWSRARFHPDQIVSSDRLRAVVGTSERDQRASADAFELLELIVAKRLRRGLSTVIDTTGLDAARRAGWMSLAARHRIPAYAVLFETEPALIRERNRGRESPVPANVVASQLKAAGEVGPRLADEEFAAVLDPADEIELVPPALVGAIDAAARQRQDPLSLRFGLQVSRFDFEGHPGTTRDALAELALEAERIGFDSLWVMDHFLQIPQIGREWEDMLESWTTLAYLAGVTSTLRLGTLVTGITYRNIAHLAKIVATLDVLSGGRAICGLGTAWFEREHELYGFRLPPRAERYEMLEDALELLPLMWGKGSPRFEGRTLTVEQATCYPRPLQERIPILIGGSGEKRTLRLVARHADACNLFGDPETVRHKLDVLRAHCETEGRDFEEIEVTHLSGARVIEPGEERTGAGAGTVQEHVGRLRELAEAGIQTSIIGLSDTGGAGPVARFADVIAAFSP
jgi:F420-dependent oxidoreductase-like protein